MSDDQEPGWAPLDPRADAARWEGMVRGIVERAAPILARYASRRPVDWLAAWARPALASAALVSALALGAMVSAGRAGTARDPSAIGLGDALGYPEPVTAWVSTGRTPTIEELVVAMEERGR